MDINSLKDNLNKSLADVSTKGIPSANFEPVWINNITRLNAQNFNARMYPTIASYITGYGNAVFEGSNEQLSNLLSILPGYKVTDTSTSEIHNLDSDLSSTNDADGAYQAVFGIGNIAQPTVTGQFLIGTYSDPYPDTLFAVGNGSNDNQKSNALEVTLDGTLKSSKINVADDITAKYITLTEVITDSSNDKYAATKKYVFDKVKTETDRATTAEQLLTTNLNKEINRAKAEENSIRAIASSAFHFKGSKPTYDDLPKTDNTVGDVWQVDDKEYAWNGTEWVELGFNIDLSDKQDKFATISHPDPDKTYTWLDITTPNVAIYNSNRKSVISMDDSGLYLQSLINHVQLAIGSQNIKISESDSISASPLLGIATPVTTEDPSKGITATDLPYQAVNKEYVDTNFQVELISGTNIKTINNQSLLGSGNIDISGGGGTISVDAELSTTSENPVQNKVITQAINDKQDKIGTISNTPMGMSLSAGNEFGFTIHPAASGATSKFIMTPKGSIEIHTNESDTQFRVTTDDILVSNGHGYTPKTTYSVANKGYVDTQVANKQDLITAGTTLGVFSIRAMDTSKTFTSVNGSYIGFFKEDDSPLLYISPERYTSSAPTMLNLVSYAQSTTIGYTDVVIKGVATPTSDNHAVNKKYVDDSVNTKLSATTDKYSISWDDINEAIKITFKE